MIGMEYVHPSASFLLISIFDRVLSSCSLTISPSRQFSAIVVPFTVFGLSRSYCHSFRHVVTIVRASPVRRCIPHRTHSNPMLSQIPCHSSRVHILLGHSFLNSNCLHTFVKLVQRLRKLPWNDQRFRRWLPQARSLLDYEAKTTTVFVLNNNNPMSLHAGLLESYFESDLTLTGLPMEIYGEHMNNCLHPESRAYIEFECSKGPRTRRNLC